MKRRPEATTTSRSRCVPLCAKFGALLAFVSTACLNPWPDDFPSNGEGVSVQDGHAPPSFSGGVGGSQGAPQVNDDPSDFFDGESSEPNDPEDTNGQGGSPGAEAPDAGAPPPDGGLRTGIRRLRSVRDGGADAE